MSYTEFEDRLLVACFLAAEEGENDTVVVDEVIRRFGLDASELYILRAVRGFYVSGFTGHSSWVGDPFDRKIEISAKGVRQAEHLISLGVSMKEKKTIVIFEDNPENIDSLREAILDIKTELSNNLISSILGDKKEVIEIELETAERVVNGRRFNLSVLMNSLGPVLKFLADKFLGSGLGELAKHAMNLIARLM